MHTALNFHATRDDVYSILSPWIEKLDVTVVGERFFPNYTADLIEQWEHGPAVLGTLDRVSLHFGKVDLDVSSALQFVTANSSGFLIILESAEPVGLRETFLSATAADDPAMRVWRKIRNDFRKSLHKGAWHVNTVSGNRARLDSHLYAPGAKLLQEQCVPILGHSERIHYELD